MWAFKNERSKNVWFKICVVQKNETKWFKSFYKHTVLYTTLFHSHTHTHMHTHTHNRKWRTRRRHFTICSKQSTIGHKTNKPHCPCPRSSTTKTTASSDWIPHRRRTTTPQLLRDKPNETKWSPQRQTPTPALRDKTDATRLNWYCGANLRSWLKKRTKRTEPSAARRILLTSLQPTREGRCGRRS